MSYGNFQFSLLLQSDGRDQILRRWSHKNKAAWITESLHGLESHEINVLVIDLCVSNHPKTYWLKAAIYYYLFWFCVG